MIILPRKLFSLLSCHEDAPVNATPEGAVSVVESAPSAPAVTPESSAAPKRESQRSTDESDRERFDSLKKAIEASPASTQDKDSWNKEAPAKTEKPKTEKPKTANEPKPNAEPAAAKVETSNAAPSETISKLDDIKPPARVDEEGWKALKSKSKELIESAESKTRQAQEALMALKRDYEEKLSAAQKERDELMPFRAAVDIHADPEFQAKYSKPMEESRNRMYAIIRKYVPQADANSINFDNGKEVESIADAIQGRDPADARLFRAQFDRFRDLSIASEGAIQEARTNHKEFVAKQKTREAATRAESETRMAQHLQNMGRKVNDKGAPEYPVLAKWEPLPEATDEQRKLIAEHNARADAVLKNVREFMSASAPEDRVEIAVSAAASAVLAETVHKQVKEIERLNELMKRLGNAEQTMANANGGSRGAAVQAGSGQEKRTPTRLPLGASVEDAMKAHFGRDR